MKIFVTGGAGFIGSNFITHVLGVAQNYSVVNFDKLTYAGNLANLDSVASNPRYTFIKGDICDAARGRSSHGWLPRRHSFRRRVSRGPKHLRSSAHDPNQRYRHLRAPPDRAPAPYRKIRAGLHRRSLRRPGPRHICRRKLAHAAQQPLLRVESQLGLDCPLVFSHLRFSRRHHREVPTTTALFNFRKNFYL